MSKLAKLIDRARYGGPTALVGMVRNKIYRREQFERWRCKLEDWEKPSNLRPDIVVEDTPLARLENFRGDSDGGLHSDFYVDRLYNGDRFFAALIDGQIAHVAWIFTRKNPSKDIELLPDEVEIRHVRTRESFLRRGVFRAVMIELLEALKDEGIKSAYVHILPDNEASKRSFGSIGFTQIAHCTMTRRLGIALLRVHTIGDLPR